MKKRKHACENFGLSVQWPLDWSNDAENVALITGINYILKYIQIESSYFK